MTRLFPDRTRIHVVRLGDEVVASSPTIAWRNSVEVPCGRQLASAGIGTSLRTTCSGRWSMSQQAVTGPSQRQSSTTSRSTPDEGAYQFKRRGGRGAHQPGPMHVEYRLGFGRRRPIRVPPYPGSRPPGRRVAALAAMGDQSRRAAARPGTSPLTSAPDHHASPLRLSRAGCPRGVAVMAASWARPPTGLLRARCGVSRASRRGSCRRPEGAGISACLESAELPRHAPGLRFSRCSSARCAIVAHTHSPVAARVGTGLLRRVPSASAPCCSTQAVGKAGLSSDHAAHAVRAA